ncbi:AAA family ATPase [Megasphaera stantonii]|uniref:AAA family ATPase n=1 Tax=Megasphaera stantonii TaxID=2144175 RepID=UPI001DDC551C|nr:AAA family ATPase [Megasphaera stantonii]HJE82938.1 AAA family ATPase [Megasphaera stantonii]
MKILSLHLENFRGIKELDIEFAGHNTDIYGANGTGKTTIANAICWLLLDRAATDEKDFNPKTTGAHDLHHKASMKLDCNGTIVTLAKDFYEIWTQKKGSATKSFSGHTTDYYINEVPSKQKEYDAMVESICGVDIDKIKMLTLHGYFIEGVKNDERRRMLFEICGDVSDDEVMDANGLGELRTILKMPGTTDQTYSIAEYKKIAAAQKRRMNKELELIPARIDEASKLMPEVLDSESVLRKQLTSLYKKQDDISRRKQEALATDDDTMTAQQINTLQLELERRKLEYLQEGNKANEAAYAELAELKKKKSSLESENASLIRKTEDSKKEIERMETMRELLLSDYAKVQAEQWDEANEICPTCGQPLPAERVEQLREEFNLRKSQKKEEINKRGQSCSATKIQDLQSRIDAADEQAKANIEKVEQLTQEIDRITATITTPVPFESTEDYASLQAQIQALRDNQQTADDKKAAIAKSFDEQLAGVSETIRAVSKDLAQIDQAKEIKARIHSLEEEQRQTAETLEQVEYGIHLCEEFVRCKAAMVTDNINSRFKTIHFKLFEDQINGGLKEICEPTIRNNDGQWVRYKSANTAAKANAELEIIDVLNKHFETDLPVVMDRAESVSEVSGFSGQLIRLIVSPTDAVLRIEQKGE